MAEPPAMPVPAPPRASGSVRPALRTVLAALCLTEIVSWGVLYYAFPVLATGIVADTGWSLTAISAAFSAGLVTSALVGIPAGRVLDRSGPRVVMTAGSVLAGLAVGLIAWSPNLPVFALAWTLAGVGMAGVLYQPAFAAVTRWFGVRHLPAIATLTLVAGLASTVFAPLTAELDARLGWRGTYLVLCIALLAITVPAHAIALRRPWPPDHHVADERTDVREYAASVTTTSRFRLLVVGLTAASLAMYAALINLVPLVRELGVSAAVAAWALGLGGVGQVAGRIVYTVWAHRISVRSRTVLVFTLSAASIAALALAPGHALILIGLSILAGIARGIATLLHATAVTDRWGPRAYGRLSGILGAPVVFASALAPWAGAALADLTGSYAATYGILAAIGVGGAVLMTLSTPSRTGAAVRFPEPAR